MKKHIIVLTLAVFAFALAPSPGPGSGPVFGPRSASGDILKLKNGQELEVKILGETATEYKVRTVTGMEFTIKKNRVISLTEKDFPPDVFEEKFAALAADDAADADGFYELGIWAKENKMKKPAKRAFEKAIEIDPDHAKTREEFGQVKFEDKWMTPEERDAILAERAAADEEAARKKFEEEQRAKGLELWKGKWLPKEEVEHLKKGEVKHRGRWMTPAKKAEMLKMEREGIVVTEKQPVEETMGQNYHIRKSLHFVIASHASDDENIQYLRGWEAAYNWIWELFEYKEGAEIFTGRARIYSGATADEAVKILTKHLGSRDTHNVVANGGSMYSTGGKWDVCSRRGTAHAQHVVQTTHSVAHIVFCNAVGNHDLPWWINEAMAMMIQLEAVHGLGGHCVSFGTGSGKRKDPSSADLLSLAKAQAQGSGGTKIKYLFPRDIRSLSMNDIAKSYSILLMMIEKDKKKFVKFCKALGGLKKTDWLKGQTALFTKIWGKTPAEWEAEWIDWVLCK